jgi:pimeloyl-ACP methyl ester carboxylesterase
MRKVLFFFVLSLGLAARTLPAQQIPAAIDVDPPADKQHPAAMESFQLPSHGAQLNALMYIAAGAGPHPVVVLLHGFPGNEKNLDLAQTIRRAGWDVLYFNYRGSWGSPGDFSFAHSTEDVAAALAYLRDPANAAKLEADPKRIVLIGHSMGGFMAAYGGSHDPAVLAIGIISGADFGAGQLAAQPAVTEAQAVSALAPRLAAEGMAPLSGCTPEGLAGEVYNHRADWNFGKLAAGMGTRPVLIVTSDDGLAPPATALADALRQGGDKRVTEEHFPTDHAYSDKRIGLETAVLAWLATLP